MKDTLQVEIGFNCLLSHKGSMLLMLPLTCKGLAGIKSLLLMYISTLSLDAHTAMYMLVAQPLKCINTPWLEGSSMYILDIPQQSP